MRIDTGKTGENAACDYLESIGHTILERNYYSRWGEIDVVTRFDGAIYFIEVKTRRNDKSGSGFESITPGKISSIKKTIYVYLENKKVKSSNLNIKMAFVEVSLKKGEQSIAYMEYTN